MEDELKTTKEELLKFVSSCDEFIDGKFILADIKISKILRAISRSPLIYNLIAESLINYDFHRDLSKISKDFQGKKGKNLQLTKDPEFVVPFVFSLLVEIDSRKVDFNEFLIKYFPFISSEKDRYDYFAKEIILPFKNAIVEIFKMEDDGKEVNIFGKNNLKKDTSKDKKDKTDESSKTEDDLIFDHLLRTINLMKDKLKNTKDSLKKSNILLLCNALYEACKTRNLTIVSALVMSLGNYCKWMKKIKSEINEINEICYQLFSK